MSLALSGGLDSRFLAHAMRLCDVDVLAVHVTGPHVPVLESAYARDWAERNGIPVMLLAFNPLDDPLAARNTTERCYHCKKGLMSLLVARTAGRLPCDGTNADDLGQHRPGLRALRELGIHSPLAAAGLGKREIRALAALTGLERPDQKARPCLMTRFAYGLAPDEQMMGRLARAEELLSSIGKNGEGLGDFRLRLLPEPCLQAERLYGDRPQQARAILQECGFGGARLMRTSPSGYFDRLKE